MVVYHFTITRQQWHLPAYYRQLGPEITDKWLASDMAVPCYGTLYWAHFWAAGLCVCVLGALPLVFFGCELFLFAASMLALKLDMVEW